MKVEERVTSEPGAIRRGIGGVEGPAAPRQEGIARWVGTPGLWAVGLGLVGLAVRLYRLDGRSLWLDELVTATAARVATLPDLMAYLHYWVDNMPLIFVLTWLGRGLGGGESVVRLPMALAGAGTVLAIYFLGKTIARPRVGLAAALGMTVLPFAVWYSQEARQYSFLMLWTTLQMLFAYRAMQGGRGRDWAAFALVTLLNLYTAYLAWTPTAAALAFIGLVGGIEGAAILRARRSGQPAASLTLRLWGRKLGGAVLAVGVIVVGYAPWFPFVREFLTRLNVDTAWADPTFRLTGAEILPLLSAFDFGGVLLLLLIAGVATAGRGLAHARWRGGLLMLVWVGLPVGAMWVKFQDAMLLAPLRYYSALYPALVLLAALGIESLSLLAGRAVNMVRRGTPSAWGRRVAYALLVALLLSQALPALARSYQDPKDDYRGAVATIAAHSPAETVVIELGVKNLVFEQESLDYYGWQQHAPITVVDGRRLDYESARKIGAGRGAVWGVLFPEAAPDAVQRARANGLDTIPLVGMTLLRDPAPGATPFQQAAALLRWGAGAEPKLETSLALLNAVADETRVGANLLPPLAAAQVPGPGATFQGTPPEQWTLWPGSTLRPDGTTVRLTTHEQEVNTTLSTARITAGQTYLLRFRYRNGDLQGTQRVYVSAHAADGQWLDVFPEGVGYHCPPAPEWAQQGFAFTAPSGTTSIIVWLRATGTGSAEFDSVQLQPLR